MTQNEIFIISLCSGLTQNFITYMLALELVKISSSVYFEPKYLANLTFNRQIIQFEFSPT